MAQSSIVPYRRIIARNQVSNLAARRALSNLDASLRRDVR
jgi:hypothetical protein